jgi:hypothetical protein
VETLKSSLNKVLNRSVMYHNYDFPFMKIHGFRSPVSDVDSRKYLCSILPSFVERNRSASRYVSEIVFDSLKEEPSGDVFLLDLDDFFSSGVILKSILISTLYICPTCISNSTN